MRIDTIESERLAALFTLVLKGTQVCLVSYKNWEEKLSDEVWEIVRVDHEGYVVVQRGTERQTARADFLRRVF